MGPRVAAQATDMKTFSGLLGSVGERRSTRRRGYGTTSTSAAALFVPSSTTTWQTETGGILISPLPGITPTKPGSATRPFPGIAAEIVTESGEKVTPLAAATWC